MTHGARRRPGDERLLDTVPLPVWAGCLLIAWALHPAALAALVVFLCFLLLPAISAAIVLGFGVYGFAMLVCGSLAAAAFPEGRGMAVLVAVCVGVGLHIAVGRALCGERAHAWRWALLSLISLTACPIAMWILIANMTFGFGHS